MWSHLSESRTLIKNIHICATALSAKYPVKLTWAFCKKTGVTSWLTVEEDLHLQIKGTSLSSIKKKRFNLYPTFCDNFNPLAHPSTIIKNYYCRNHRHASKLHMANYVTCTRLIPCSWVSRWCWSWSTGFSSFPSHVDPAICRLIIFFISVSWRCWLLEFIITHRVLLNH